MEFCQSEKVGTLTVLNIFLNFTQNCDFDSYVKKL